MKKWWVYINGYRVVETKSIGYKWVRYRTSENSLFRRIKRSEWDKACISTLNISNVKKSRKKFGWSYKTFTELESEVIDKEAI